MSDLPDAMLADAWGRRLEGEPDPTGTRALSEALHSTAPGSGDGLASRLVADEQIDRLLRGWLAPPAAAEQFIAGVIAAIDPPGIDVPAAEATPNTPPLLPSNGRSSGTEGGIELPAITVGRRPPRLTSRPIQSDRGAAAAMVTGLGLAAAGVVIAIIQPWTWRAVPERQPAPRLAKQSPGPTPQPLEPASELPPRRPEPDQIAMVEVTAPPQTEPVQPRTESVPQQPMQSATWTRGGPSAGGLPMGIHELASGTTTVEAVPGLIVTLQAPTEIQLGPGPLLDIRRGRVWATAEPTTAVRIVTPAAAVTELAGEILVDVATSGATSVEVLSGKASFADLVTRGRATALRQGQRATAELKAAAAAGAMSGSSIRTGGTSISISEQVINGRFRGTITIDGNAQVFESREAFERAKRNLQP